MKILRELEGDLKPFVILMPQMLSCKARYLDTRESKVSPILRFFGNESTTSSSTSCVPVSKCIPKSEIASNKVKGGDVPGAALVRPPANARRTHNLSTSAALL